MGSDPGMKECGPGLGRWEYNRKEVGEIDKYVISGGKMFIYYENNMKTILQEIRNKRKTIFIPTTLTP